ncbi:SDR family NAD(P)-dependent oxidoreductase [Sciscionella marina]|uniref:SDR family NAD(P)-dependent oxidoreductase n=1 Tax=Sciscionella marina TaxID=508770 RepID=UPI00035F55D7|nr:SDR family NAD(P)-dependent oxidoreductase [Sciscionella marina]
MKPVALVTGGAHGIGAAVARRFAAHQLDVVIADIEQDAGSELGAELGAIFVRADVASESDNRAAVDAALTAFGRLDIVHLNAGIGGPGPISDGDFDRERYRRTLAVAIDGTVFGIRAALPALAASGGGAIVVTASLAGIAPAPFDPVYAAAKHAAIGLVRSMTPTVAESEVTLNAVCPGFVDTPMIAEARAKLLEYGVTLADPDEVAAAVQSIAAGGETGQAWKVQAGQAPALVSFPVLDTG